jgi:hypothetical protein
VLHGPVPLFPAVDYPELLKRVGVDVEVG